MRARITSSPKTEGGINLNWLPKDESNPYFTYDPSKCIVCSRCVRACEEVQGTFALTISGRGFDSRVSPGMNESFLGSECVSCGACVQACPTATLNEKKVIEIGKPEHSVVTTCAYCGVGCAFKAEMRGEELVRMVPYKDGEANRGHSCVKGRFAWGYATHKERILKPMIRSSIHEPWNEVSWDEAIDYAASEFKRIQAQYGRGAVGGITSSRCTNEETYPGAEADPRRLRQQQRRYLRPRLPLADRLRPRPGLRHLGRHAEFQLGRGERRHRRDRRQSGRGASGVCLAHEEAPAAGRQADRDRSAPHRDGEVGRMSRRTIIWRCLPGTNVAVRDRARACHRDRRALQRDVHPRALRLG